MKKKLAIVLVVISSILFIGGGILLSTTFSSNQKKDDKPVQEEQNEVENDEPEVKDEDKIILEEISSMSETELNEPDMLVVTELLNLSKQAYKNDQDIKLNEEKELFVSIKDFKEKNNLDTSKLSTFELTCNEETTGIKFIKQGSEIIRIPVLNCK